MMIFSLSTFVDLIENSPSKLESVDAFISLFELVIYTVEKGIVSDDTSSKTIPL